MITTDGFRDLLEIGRQKRPDLYDLQADKPPQLVPRDRRIEVEERVRHDGSVEIRLDIEEVRAVARSLRTAGAKAVAICFLYGFLHSEHEAAAKTIVEEVLPDAFISASHEVAPEFREYERLSTTTVNAFLGPVMRRYIERLGERLRDLGNRRAAQADAIQRRYPELRRSRPACRCAPCCRAPRPASSPPRRWARRPASTT